MTMQGGVNSTIFPNGSTVVGTSPDLVTWTWTITPATDANGNVLMPPNYVEGDERWPGATIAPPAPYVAPNG